MTTWYKVSGIRWSFSKPQIEAHDIVKTTTTRVYFKNKRWENKANEYHRWFDTYDEAYNWVVSLTELRLNRLKTEFNELGEKLTHFKKEFGPQT